MSGTNKNGDTDAADDHEIVWRDDRVRWAEDFEDDDLKKNTTRKKKTTSTTTNTQTTTATEGYNVSQSGNISSEVDNEDSDDDEEEEEETAFLDPFKDPDPFQTFEFKFPYPTSSASASTSSSSDSMMIQISLRGYKKDADQVWQSTGVTLWRASEYLCQYLLRKQIELDSSRGDDNGASSSSSTSSFLRGKRILELGAGLGLCGILAHHLAGPDGTVCITDGDTDALILLRENIDKNKCSLSPSSSSSGGDVGNRNGGHVYARQLIWGHDMTESFLTKHCHDEPFDVLIASDIVYALVIVEPLWETVRLLLRRRQRTQREELEEDNGGSGGDYDRPCFLMAYAKRDVPVTIEMVLQAATKAGFEYELVDEDPEGIWVYKFWWNEEELNSSE